MGTKTNSRRSHRASKRGLASFVSFLLLFAFALGQSGSLIALANDSGTAPAATDDAGSDGSVSRISTLPVAQAPSEEASGAEVGSGDSGASSGGGAASTSRTTSPTRTLHIARANRPAALARPAAPPVTGLQGGDIGLDFVAAGPFTYNHATGLGSNPPFGYNSRTINKNTGVVESLEGGDFECGDLVTFFVQVEVAGDAAGSGAVALDMSFGNETTGQPGIGFDDIVSVAINTPDGGNVGLDGTETATLSNEHLDTAGYDEVKGTVTVSGLDGGETAIVRIIVHLACELNASPTGNILNAIDAARVVGDGKVSVGQETVPMKQVGGLQAEPGIDVFKDCPATAVAGDAVTYEITVTNTGNVDLSNITVIDDIIGDLSGDFPDTLAVGSDPVTRQVEYTPVPGDGDPLKNTVTASGNWTAGETSDSVSDTASCTTDIVHPAITVTKSCPQSAFVGGEISNTIRVTNSGDEDLEKITVNDTILGDLSASFADTLVAGAFEEHSFTYTVGTSPDPLVNVVTATGTGVTSEKVVQSDASCSTDVLHPAINIVKDGPALVHVGDTITYTFEVTNPGELELFDVVLSDPICDAGTIVPGADVDSSLAVGEVWHYTCTHLVTAEDGELRDPLPNTATITGDTSQGEGGEPVSDTDDHLVDIINPGISIVKTVDEEVVPIGTTVTFTYVIVNTGDTTLYNVSVDDDILGHVGDIEVLEPGDQVTLTKDFVVGDEIVTNVGTAVGEDVLGRSVSANDDATVAPISGENPPPPNPPTTPFTGSDAGRLGIITMVLFGIGVTVVASTRRRRPKGEAA
jgi:uncharacterized repeat protein (TIGR01451 family)